MDDLLSIAVSNAVAATILSLAAILIGAVYRRPALVHGLWLLVLLKLVTPPLVFFPIAWPTGEESSPEVAAVREKQTIALPGGSRSARPTLQEPVIDLSVSEEGPAGVEALPPIEEPPALYPIVPQEPPLWPLMLRIVWAFGAMLWFLLALERLNHFRRLIRFARPAPAALQERTRRLADSLGLRRCPRVRLLPGRIAPMLWAIGGAPRLLVPANLLNVLSEEQLDTLLLHELAHLRRRDHWVRVLEFVVMGLYWWHPVVWYARRELHEAEEQCCDAWVVSTLPGTGRTYASALLETLDFLSTTQAAVPPLASGLSQIADLKRRLTMIMQGNTPRSLTWPGCLAVVALGLTLLPMMPSLHGEPPDKAEASKAVEQAEKALEAAKAALEQQKALLAQKKAALAQAAARLKAEAGRKARENAVRARTRYDELKKSQSDSEKKSRTRIEIVIDGNINAADWSKKLVPILPEKSRMRIESPEVSIEYQNGRLAIRSRIEKPAAGGRKTTAPAKPQEKRIDDLEKKLEKVLRELQQLRKQIGNNTPPAEPAPPAPPASSATTYRPVSPNPARPARATSPPPPAPPSDPNP